jgi:CPA1 family monovalent cation:H+ antiporter
MMIGVAAVVLARSIAVFGGLALIQRVPGITPLPLRDQIVVVFGGVTGTVTLALALSLPIELDAWYTVQSIAYGIVVYMLFIQGPVLGVLLRRLAG